MKAREIKALHEAVYSQYYLLLQYSNRAADAAMIPNMNITKAQEVQQVMDGARRDNLYLKDCYALTIDTAVTLGGIEIDNSPMTETSASKVTFEFDDLSRAQVRYGSVLVIC